MVALLPESTASRLRTTPFTYPEVGATTGPLPAGYGRLERSRLLPAHGFELGAERLMSWQVHEAAGLRVAASDLQVVPGAVVELFLGPRLLRIRAVCRVVHVIDEPDRIGFAYGTLPGHAESGEESFLLERTAAGTRFTVRAFSRPATVLTRVGGPVTRRVQWAMAGRYLEGAG